jgi:uncharacterized SAM-dependent methyltransferase
MATAPRLTPSLLASQALAEFSSDVVVGLGQPGQKELPSKYLYDEVGSALFDVICLLPEYGLSRAGMRLLKRFRGGSALTITPSIFRVPRFTGASRNSARWTG